MAWVKRKKQAAQFHKLSEHQNDLRKQRNVADKRATRAKEKGAASK